MYRQCTTNNSITHTCMISKITESVMYEMVYSLYFIEFIMLNIASILRPWYDTDCGVPH